jgi:small conductance mechanosensitive channel
MLDALHGAGIEIVSPAYMNQRQVSADRRVIPAPPAVVAAEPAESVRPAPEQIMFDKAELAESREQLNQRLEGLGEQINALQQRAAAERDETVRADLTQQLHRLETQRDAATAAVERFDRATAQPAETGAAP